MVGTFSISSKDFHGDNKNTVHVSERLPVISRSNSGIAMKEEYEEHVFFGKWHSYVYIIEGAA